MSRHFNVFLAKNVSIFNSIPTFYEVYFIMLKVLIISTAAGVVGTMLGGIIASFVKRSANISSIASLFAGGFMLAIASFELIPEAVAAGSIINVVLSFIAGIIVVILAKLLLSKENSPLNGSFAIFIAIAIHNFPEGLAIGGGEVVSIGLSIALLIAIHNIPEGLALSLPLIQSGKSNAFAIALAALAGVPTAIGGLLGHLLSFNSQFLVCSCLSLAAGSMTFVTFSDILPSNDRSGNTENILLFTSIGFLLGFIACNIL